jgi:hypothetical protein
MTIKRPWETIRGLGLKPDELEEREAGSKHALFKVGQTELVL